MSEREELNSLGAWDRYQRLVEVEGKLIWDRFHVMVVANSILLGGVAVVIGTSSGTGQLTDVARCFSLLLLGAGVLLCILWYFLNSRGWRLHDTWLQEAKRCEPISGYTFFKLEGPPPVSITQCVPVRILAPGFIVAFLAIYVVAIILLSRA